MRRDTHGAMAETTGDARRRQVPVLERRAAYLRLPRSYKLLPLPARNLVSVDKRKLNLFLSTAAATTATTTRLLPLGLAQCAGVRWLERLPTALPVLPLETGQQLL
jgi:hypothetical protein